MPATVTATVTVLLPTVFLALATPCARGLVQIGGGRSLERGMATTGRARRRAHEPRARCALCMAVLAAAVVSVAGFAPLLPRVTVGAPAPRAARPRGARLSMSDESGFSILNYHLLNRGLQ